MEDIIKLIADDDTFERMKTFNGNPWEEITYAEFILWNINCFREFDNDEKKDILQICKLISSKRIALVDEEHCQECTASAIYFNKNKKLCIVNPR